VEVHAFFLTLLAILLAARVLGELAARLGIPPVIGELAAGVALGPSLFGWIEPTTVIRLLAEIGIILLLFEVGLETDVLRLIRTGVKSLVVAAAGVVLPFGFGFAAAAYLFHQDLLTSLFIGGTLTATSIGITVRVLTDLGRSRSHEANIVLGAAVLDDVVGVVMLALLYEFSQGGGISLLNTGKVSVFILLFMALAPLAAKGMAEVIKRFEKASQIPGLIPTTVVSLVLFFAWLAYAVGAPELLGGFAAGLALSRRFFLPMGAAIRTDPEFAQRMEKQMHPIIHLFTPIFFVTVGLSLNFRLIDWSSGFIWLFSLTFMVLAVAGKLLGGFLIREPRHTRLAIGLAMVPRGEVGLIFTELGRSSGIFSNEVYAAMVIVIALTTLLPPFALKWLYRRYPEPPPPARGRSGAPGYNADDE
jgi:Na+:H+ antiporter